jgi:hypothetical protein
MVERAWWEVELDKASAECVFCAVRRVGASKTFGADDRSRRGDSDLAAELLPSPVRREGDCI